MHIIRKLKKYFPGIFLGGLVISLFFFGVAQAQSLSPSPSEYQLKLNQYQLQIQELARQTQYLTQQVQQNQLYSPSPSSLLPRVDGACGTAAGPLSRDVINDVRDRGWQNPTVSLFCSAGVFKKYFETDPFPPAPGFFGVWQWQCLGFNGGKNVLCSTDVISDDGICGPAAIVWPSGMGDWPTDYSSARADKFFCQAGMFFVDDDSLGNEGGIRFPTPGVPSTWECVGRNNAKCAATLAYSSPVSSSPQTYSPRPYTGLPPSSGTCGSAARIYGPTDTGFIGYFCSSGLPSPSKPSFPEPGATTGWYCVGSDGGNTQYCFARRDKSTSASSSPAGFNILDYIRNQLASLADSVAQLLGR